METDAAAPPPSRIRRLPLLLLVLGAVSLAFLVMNLGGSADPSPPSSNARAPQRTSADVDKLDAGSLDVRLEALSRARPGPGETERDPFRFKPKPAPPAPRPVAKLPETAESTGPPQPPPPPAPPPITVKFIGTLALQDGTTVAILTDCTVGRMSVRAREGEIILGQYRLVKVGLTSVVVEHLDGRGRTTLPKTGQECVK